MAPLKVADAPGLSVPPLKRAEETGRQFLARLGVNDLKAARALDAKVIQKAVSGMGSYWVSFAKSGDPNGSGLPNWPVFTEQEMTAMCFDQQPDARLLPNLEKLKAIDAYFAWRREDLKTGAGEGR